MSTAVGTPRFVDHQVGVLFHGNKPIPIGPDQMVVLGRAGADQGILNAAAAALADGAGPDRRDDDGDKHKRGPIVIPVVLDDPEVSAIHAVLVSTRNGVRLRDHGSTNGTFVDGLRAVELFLTKDVEIRCGRTVLRFTLSPAPKTVDAGIDAEIPSLVGTTREMRFLYQQIHKVARTDHTILIIGETGTGKELVARAIHDLSDRARGPYVIVDAGAITPALAESALFGHEKGGFTGALDRRLSPFVEADGGTIFIDEIGDAPIEVQALLLRAFQERKVKAIGSNVYREFNARIIVATRRDLERRINEGKFRSDLYYRLCSLRLDVPALRERIEDIPALVEYFVSQIDQPDRLARISRESLAQVMQHDWPGNVRELQGVVARALAFAADVGPIHLEVRKNGSESELDGQVTTYHAALEEFKRRYWRSVHTLCKGRLKDIIQAAGVSKTAALNALKTYDVKE